MLRIRLRRVGKNHQPSYRIVVAESTAARNGKIVEQVGLYNPLTDPPTVVVSAEKVGLWLSRGARPSDTVQRLLAAKGITQKAGSP